MKTLTWNHTATKLTLGALAGAALGLGFWALIGCRTGACPLTSNPWSASLGGAVLGALMVKG